MRPKSSFMSVLLSLKTSFKELTVLSPIMLP